MTDSRGVPPQQAVVVGPGGLLVPDTQPGQHGQHGQQGAGPAGQDSEPLTNVVEQPAKVMRIGTMIKQLLEEVRSAPLDEEGRARLRHVHEASIAELEQGLAPELREELRRITLPFEEDEVPTEAELRVAQAQLVGWLEGLFHGIQTALFAQQMAARAQFEEIRRRALRALRARRASRASPVSRASRAPSLGRSGRARGSTSDR